MSKSSSATAVVGVWTWETSGAEALGEVAGLGALEDVAGVGALEEVAGCGSLEETATSFLSWVTFPLRLSNLAPGVMSLFLVAVAGTLDKVACTATAGAATVAKVLSF